jgi:hypothetical protein
MSSTLEQREKLKREYGWLYEALVQLLAEYDPMHLLIMGAPSDEYDIEVDVILLRLNEASSPTIWDRSSMKHLFSVLGQHLLRPIPHPLNTQGNALQNWAKKRGLAGDVGRERHEWTYKAVQLHAKEEAEAALGRGTSSIDCLVDKLHSPLSAGQITSHTHQAKK